MVFIVRQDAELVRPDPARKVVKAADVWAFKDARALVEDARNQAAQIVGGAREAYEQERKRGYLEGVEQAKLEASGQMMETVGRTVDYFAQVEERMVDLVMAAVRRVVEDFDNRTRVLVAVRNSLAFVRNQKQLTLRVHPDRVEAVKSSIADLLAMYPAIGFLDIVGDPRVAPDACIVDSEIGIVEASFEGQIETLRKAFKKVLGDRV